MDGPERCANTNPTLTKPTCREVDMADKIVSPQNPPTCSIEGCERKRHARGYCANHYARWRYYGDASKGRDRTRLGEPLRWISEHAYYQGDDCIVWPFERTQHGYGSVKHNGKRRVASRVMCEVAHGYPDHADMDAAHVCGNGSQGCMNPNHLKWKSRSDNNRDKIAHGTHRQGEDVNFSTTTEWQAREILRLRGKMKQSEIAERVGVSVGVVAHIHNKSTWKHVAEDANYEFVHSGVRRGEDSGNAKLAEEDVREIRRLRGVITNKEIGERFGIDPSYVSKIQKRKWWRWLDG